MTPTFGSPSGRFGQKSTGGGAKSVQAWGLGLGIGIGDWGLGLGLEIGIWDLDRGLGLGIDCDFLLLLFVLTFGCDFWLRRFGCDVLVMTFFVTFDCDFGL